MTAGDLLFGLCAVACLAGAITTISAQNPIRGAMGLLTTIFGIAGLFLILSAEFLTAIQLIVYAGAVVVLFVFVLMLLGADARAPARSGRSGASRAFGGGLFALTSLGFYALPEDPLQLAFALQVTTGAALGVVSTITFAMTADTADHNAWKTGHRATAMTYSMIIFGKKIAMALVALVVAWAFATHGTAGAEASPQLLTNVRLMVGLAPAVLAIAGALVAQFYGLSAETLAREQVGSL